MKREIVKTADGSFTLREENSQECFHSTNGAYTESMHIFIKNGLKYYLDKILDNNSQQTHVNILEIGFGTGLNCILTAVSLEHYPNITTNYNTIEKYPLTIEEFEQLNYKTIIDQKFHAFIKKIHLCNWNKREKITDRFFLNKIEGDLKELHIKKEQLLERNSINVVYFDAFSPNIDPTLWSKKIFKNLFELMDNNAVLVTYSVKGDVKRALREAGFNVTRKAGPPGKRHITIARKLLFN